MDFNFSCPPWARGDKGAKSPPPSALEVGKPRLFPGLGVKIALAFPAWPVDPAKGRSMNRRKPSHPCLLALAFSMIFPLRAAWPGTSLWQAVPLVSQSALEAGNGGGEGCQVIQNFAIDSTGNFLMMATNVGGLYRSLDGGARWEPANVGYGPGGGAPLAIDPNNLRRVIAVGGNSGRSQVNGLWLSTDQGGSWKPVLQQMTRAAETYHDSVAFDPSSRKSSAGETFSALAYWVAYSDAGGGLWKSHDGGRTWKKIQASFSDGIVKVNPKSGAVYVATAEGFFRSQDRGAHFTAVTPGPVLGLDVVATSPTVPSKPAGSGLAELSSVSCVSDIQCVAVGYDQPSAKKTTTLIETLKGGHWSVTPSSGSTPTPGNGYKAVSCWTNGFCTAVGQLSGSVPLVGSSTGGTWTMAKSPEPSRLDSSTSLNGVACQSSVDCVAVGDLANRNNPQVAERALGRAGQLP